ncbi:MAG: hypothetical protein DWQ34_23430 [Planctomycetota bacterium]|nr:MAG: hypothetical protein DWQ34_23430 [Planctomycetota bacterium]REJ95438.1 MAG: hypothetical protein DWQ29_02030 [Planctomycetota bacterium]REK24175.1 MAG: hypothetical protein DWQ41_14120 [Planctomycetota bacterium]REK28838.1 MAG: hypothetical protein DWQ45_24395 [Planctomycetota bacterium]
MLSDARSSPMRILLIGNPTSRRASAFVAAAGQRGIRIDVVSYPQLLGHRLNDFADENTLVRIESPGECAETTRLILRAGTAPMESRGRIPIGGGELAALNGQRGEILHPLQWYLGFREVLNRLERAWSGRGVRWMSTPRAVAMTFDKLACVEAWEAAGLPIPHRFPPFATYSELRRNVPQRHARVFLKLRYGYSAMGAVALEWRASSVRAITTVDVVWSRGRPRLFVTKRPRVLHREFEIAWLIDTLAMEEVLAEAWLPKARWRGRSFDLRIVTIGQRVQHTVGRSSDSPFTNLNLDARRIPRTDIVPHLGAAWAEVESSTARAARLIPDAATLGIDVLVRPCRRKFVLLEANAFGDYLPGLLHNGLTTYEAQLRSLHMTDRKSA